jgi:hypothetical protein
MASEEKEQKRGPGRPTGLGPGGKFDRDVWKNMTPRERARAYSADWWEKNKERVTKERKKRYHKDESFREKILDASKTRRPIVRAQKAEGRFEAMVAEKKLKAQAKGGKTEKRPRFVSVDGKEQFVYPAGHLALECGREPATIRLWLERDILPGATMFFGEGTHGTKSYFSEGFVKAVVEACRVLYHLDGNGSRTILKRLVREELAKTEESYVPHGKTEAERVRPQASKA